MAQTGDMTCKELVQLATEYLEERLPSKDRQRLEEHLTLCPYCRIYMEQMRQTVCLLGKMSEDSILEDDKQELLERFQNWQRI